MHVKLDGVTIRSIATAIPDEVFDLTDLYDFLDKTEIEHIIKMNGITKVRIAPEGLCASDLCEKAAGLILEEEDKKNISGLVFVSQTPDYILPATSASLQHRLGLSKNIVSFDLGIGCPGYIYGLYQAALLVSSG
ncbi:hypothetical protein QUF76_15325, partial [Desulfobacterales bacterium HSG16]|nr:hypothetical protein [Desulfobacterales bacterium HSG16]